MQTNQRSCDVAMPSSPDLLQIRIEDFRYLVHFASTREEVEAALKLRFEVFNLELGEGLDSSFQTGRDRDEFDPTCHHLLVTEKASGAVIGTYRLRTIEMARDAAGFYSAAEFEIQRLPSHYLQHAVELGRACIALQHRNRQVLFLLWRGLAAYMKLKGKRFAFGCCSLTSQDPTEGWSSREHLLKNGHYHESLDVGVMPDYRCDQNSATDAVTVKIPKLFANYLAINAKVVSPPALDQRFKTIDFLVLLDIETMDPRIRALFFD